MTLNKSTHNVYFKLRNVDKDCYSNYTSPNSLLRYLPEDKNAKILDIGCGFGQMLSALKKMGYFNGYGIDICNEAIDYCLHERINVKNIINIIEFACSAVWDKYDFIKVSHMLEHIDNIIL